MRGLFPTTFNPADHTGPCTWYQDKGVIRDIITSLGWIRPNGHPIRGTARCCTNSNFDCEPRRGALR